MVVKEMLAFRTRQLETRQHPGIWTVLVHRDTVSDTRTGARRQSQRPAAIQSGTDPMGQTTLLILSKQSPEMDKHLTGLPKEAHILAISQDDAGISDLSDEQLGSVKGALTQGGGPSVQLLQKLFPKLTGLQWVHSMSAGLDKLLFPDLVSSNVVITNAKGAFSSSLAEYAIAGCCYFAKQLPRLMQAKAERKWEQFTVQELRGKTMGIVGYGDIGQACARLARAYQMHVIALRRRTELSGDEQNSGLKVYPPDQLKSLMAECDFVVMALPGTPATQHFVGKEAIKSMKSTGVLINIGRGSTLDTTAARQALEAKKIKGAVLDVFEQEPLAKDDPLWGLDNLLLSPHCADLTDTFLQDSMQAFLRNVGRFCSGQELENQVDKHAGY